MTDNTTLLARANEILADCNQLPSAREVIAKLVEALPDGVSMGFLDLGGGVRHIVTVLGKKDAIEALQALTKSAAELQQIVKQQTEELTAANDALVEALPVGAPDSVSLSARIKYLVEALRVEPDADVAELITTGREYVRQVAGQAAYLWSNQMTVLCDALEREHRARRVAEGENARLVVALEWEVELKRALMPYQLRAITAEERITILQSALHAAGRLLQDRLLSNDLDSRLPHAADLAIVREALAILTPTPNVAENGLEQRVEVPE